MNRTRNITQILLRNDYAGLEAFYKMTWDEPSTTETYLFRVYFSQKSYNLNEIFFQTEIKKTLMENRTRLRKLRKRTFLTQSGLIMQAAVLAKYFMKNRTFPRIALCDELMNTGRDFAEAIGPLFRAVVTELEAKGRSVLSDEAALLHEKLVGAVDFYTYAMVDTPKARADLEQLLIADNYRRRVDYQTRVNPAEWHAMIDAVAAAVVFSPHVENTSFIPMFRLDRETYLSLSERLQAIEGNNMGWKREHWNYRNKISIVWQKNCYDINNALYMQQALRCSYNVQSDKYIVVPYLFWNALENSENELLLQKLGQLLKNANYNRLSALLLDRRDYNTEIGTQLMMTLSSILVFCGFMEDGGTQAILAGADKRLFSDNNLEQVSECYGTMAPIYLEFARLVRNEVAEAELRDQLWNVLRNYLLTRAEPLSGDAGEGKTDCGRDLYLLAAVKYFWNRELNLQKEIEFRHLAQIKFTGLSQFYDNDCFLSDYLESFPAEYQSLDRKIGALIILMQWGVTSQKVYRRRKVATDTAARWDQQVPASRFYTEAYLKVGEGTCMAGVMHMYRFLPALIEIEKACEESGRTTRNWVRWFGRYLDEMNSGSDFEALFDAFFSQIYIDNGRFSDWEKLNLVWLDQPDFDEEVRTVQEWTGKPWPEEERRAIQNMTYKEYILWEKEQQQACKQLALQFLGH